MKKKILSKANGLLWFFILTALSVRGQTMVEISGKVYDENNRPLSEVNIISSVATSVTGEDGAFMCNVYELNDFITVRKEGYETREIKAKSIEKSEVILLNSLQTVPLINRVKEKPQITGAVEFLRGDKVENIPGTNRMNSLTGRIPGLWVNQINGMPGEEFTSLKIRGQNSFGASRNSPTILLDGVPVDFSQVDPYDIESVTVLKDAASAAMYGLRSSNGVILINTKRGQAGEIQVNLNSQVSMVEPLQLPKFLDAYQYALLYNEAATNDGLAPKYSQEDLTAFQGNSDIYTHPNVNWVNQTLKDHSIQSRNNLNISGGSDIAQYYFSLGYLTNSGLYKVDEDINTYNTNSNLKLANIHTNVNLKLSDRLNINVDLKANQDSKNNPGPYSANYETDIFQTLYGTPPLAHPIMNEDGSLAGNDDYQNNLFGKLNYAGYSIWKRNSMFVKTNMAYDMDFITEGLSLIGMFSYNNFNVHITDRGKNFAVYEVVDEAVNKIGQDTKMESSSAWGDNTRFYAGELGFKYDKGFGNHQLSSMVLVERQEESRRSTKLPRVYQGIRGYLSYSNNKKYLADFTFAVQGSEQFPKENRYGFFPAISLGWVMSEESFLKTVKPVSSLKLRGSAGITGNDFDPYVGSNPYFAYLQNYSENGNYPFGTTASNWDGGFQENGIANNAITWEKVHKYNLGIDASFFGNGLSVSMDYFYEKSNDILIDGANPKIFGASFLYPVGEAENKGWEGMVNWQESKGNFTYYLSANATMAKSGILEQNEEFKAYEWMKRTGNPIGSKFGYVFERYFTEDDDFANLPDQSQLGSVQPGDLKYKDLNGDMVIDQNDVRLIGKSGTPEFFYGLSTGLSYKGLDLNILFQGISGIDRYYKGHLNYEFLNGKGNVNSRHLGRWVPGSGQSATYPRLSIGSAQNNRVNSDYWLKDGSYFRLKTIEVGYTLPSAFTEKINVSHIRIYTSGYNLYTWDNIEFTDPESATDGIGYPISRYFTAGLNISF